MKTKTDKICKNCKKPIYLETRYIKTAEGSANGRKYQRRIDKFSCSCKRGDPDPID